MDPSPPSDPSLEPVARLVHEGKRLGAEEALALYRTADTAGVGHLADQVRARRCGEAVHYVVNRHINPTNLCVYRCSFCAFARREGEAEAYEMSLDEVRDRAAEVAAAGATEVHLVGGLHPRWGLARYLELIQVLRESLPRVHLKALTAVEVAYLARRERRSVEEILRELVQAGVGSLPGGGAEILHPEVRRVICDAKHRAVDWLEVHRTAHRMGIPSTATMLYGHLERPEHRVHHLLELRRLQEDQEGFLAYVPLRFHPEGTPLQASGQLEGWQAPPAVEDLRELAVARLVLDNFANIKAYWVMISLESAARSLHWGVNDLDGTVEEERIVHMAGARTPQACTSTQLQHLIRSQGRRPVERDSLYRPVHRDSTGRWSVQAPA